MMLRLFATQKGRSSFPAKSCLRFAANSLYPLALPYLGWLPNQTRKMSSCRFTLGILKLKAQKLEDKISAAGTSITTAQFSVLYILEGI